MKQQLSNALGLEEGALVVLKGGIKSCFEASDNASRDLLEHILVCTPILANGSTICPNSRD
ncbi:MAG: hypothetical protein ACXW6K_23410 [Candidatus Binatia bacterium]